MPIDRSLNYMTVSPCEI